MDIITKRDGPRREDMEAKRHIQRNLGTIERLADQLSGGAYSARKKIKKMAPQASGLILSDLGAGKSVADEPRPYLRITPNGRVALLDLNTGLQMQVLGQITRKNGQNVFLLATKKSGFISPIDPDLFALVSVLNGVQIDNDFSEEKLSERLKDLLSLS